MPPEKTEQLPYLPILQLPKGSQCVGRPFEKLIRNGEKQAFITLTEVDIPRNGGFPQVETLPNGGKEPLYDRRTAIVSVNT